jgi:protein TonB
MTFSVFFRRLCVSVLLGLSVSFSSFAQQVNTKTVAEEEEPAPFQLVDVKPSFQGGDANAFSRWVNMRLAYPELAKDNGVQGRVTVQFTIEKDGTVTNVKVLRGVDPSLDAEAVRVVSSSPKWTPGMMRGKVVRVNYTYPVVFSLR